MIKKTTSIIVSIALIFFIIPITHIVLANTYGFCLPLDNMNLIVQKGNNGGHISGLFSMPSHDGLDINWPGISGTLLEQ